MRLFLHLLVLSVATGCSGTEPVQYGPLKSRIIEGRVQPSVIAGTEPTAAVNQSYREPVATAARAPSWRQAAVRLAELASPAPLHAQAHTAIKVQPGAVACIREDQSVLVPKTRCVTADSAGNSRFEWLTVTKAGTYRATVSSTYGLEQTKEDTVSVTILPGPADPNRLMIGFPATPPPAAIADDAAVDSYGNRVPYRVVSDAHLTAQGDTLGTLAARTVMFTNASVGTGYHVTQLVGRDGVLVGRLRYRIVIASAGFLGIEYSIYGTGQPLP